MAEESPGRGDDNYTLPLSIGPASDLPGPPAPPSTSTRHRRAIRLAAGAAGVAMLIGVIVTGVSLAGAGSTPTAQAAQVTAMNSLLTGHSGAGWTGAARCHAVKGNASRTHHARHCRRLIRLLRLLPGWHGQLTFTTKTGTHTLSYERGVITSVSAMQIVVRAADGTSWTWHLTGRTLVVSALRRARVSIRALAPGQRVFVAGPTVSGIDDARLVLIRVAHRAG